MCKEYKIGAIIVAAGSGLRFGEKKQIKRLGTKPLYLYSLQRFIDCDLIDEIVLVVPNDLLKTIFNEVAKLNPRIKVVAGGKLRQDSVLVGVNTLSNQCEIVCIHDAARPFVSAGLIHKTISSCERNDGAVAAIPSNDTVKEINTNDNSVIRTIPRGKIWLVQTPQAFHRQPLIIAMERALAENIQGTDEAVLLERLEYRIVVVEGNTNNMKITDLNDWELAEILVEKQNYV